MTGLNIQLTNLNQFLSITTPKSSPIKAVIVDTWDNRKNIYSSNLIDHSVYIPMEVIESRIIDNEYSMTYNIPAYAAGLTKWVGLYFIVVEFEDKWENDFCADNQAIVFDSSLFYCFRSTLIDSACEACTDLKNYEKLELLMFRETMFKDAVSLGRTDDAIYYFEQILQLMGGGKPCFECVNPNTCVSGNKNCSLGIGIIGDFRPTCKGPYIHLHNHDV
jgi:hypothetical protein